MYLFLPFLFMWRKRSVWRLMVLWVVCGLLGHFVETIPALAWFTLLLFVPNFLPGVIAFTLPQKPRIPSYLWWIRRVGGGLCLLLGLLIPLFSEISFGLLKRASKWIATYSYGIYLAHSFCIWVGLTEFQSWALFLIMMLALPVLLYHAVERPFIKVGTRIADRLSEPKGTDELPVLAEAE